MDDEEYIRGRGLPRGSESGSWVLGKSFRVKILRVRGVKKL